MPASPSRTVTSTRGAGARRASPLLALPVLSSLPSLRALSFAAPAFLALAFACDAPARAQEAGGALPAFGLSAAEGRDLVTFTVMVGVILFALVAAVWLIRARRRQEAELHELHHSHATLKARLERAESLLDVPDQRVAVWTAGAERPHLRGRLEKLAGVPEERDTFLMFDGWMAPEHAGPFREALERLIERATPFDTAVESRAGDVLEVQGRASGSQAFVRFAALGPERAELARLRKDHAHLAARFDTVSTLLEALDAPAWMRDDAGRLAFVNRAYVHAVEGVSVESVLRHGTPLLDRRDREQVSAHHETTRAEASARVSVFRRRLPVTVAGDRRTLDVTEARTASGAFGLGVDMSEVERTRAAFDATVQGQRRTLDRLATAVAAFDEHRRLRFFNQAFLSLWGLERTFLQDEPDNAQLLEELRARGRIPERRDFREWRDGLLEVYQSQSTLEERWTLPDGRTIRVVANPEATGGVTWVFENVTEQLELETTVTELTRVQSETLAHLGEAVAVFGSDGRLKLSNPAFAQFWGLPEGLVGRDAPLDAIVGAMREATVESADAGEEGDVWDDLAPAVSGAGERTDRAGRIRIRPNYARGASEEERVLDYALVPLPNGQSMMTFADVTASIRVADALLERNEALLDAERLKNRFLQQVSTEFRSPLQSVMGFAEMLHQGLAGELPSKSRNYVNYIMASAEKLTRLVDDTLDLATMEAGLARLRLEETDVAELLKAASVDVAGTLADRGLTLETSVAGSAGTAFVDGRRLRQVVTNLLSNAARHSPPGGRVRLRCTGDRDEVVVTVSDEGPGIEPDMTAAIFERFEAGQSGGPGLGLAIAKSVVNLHGGTIAVAPPPNVRLLDGATETGGASDELGGASFVVRLPRGDVRHAAAN